MNSIRYVIVFVSEMRRSVAFYRDILNLPLKFESPDWTEFSTGDVTLALHSAGAATTACYAARGTPPAHAQLGLHVPDLDQFHAQMVQSQVHCRMPPSRQEFGGRRAMYTDPDGLPFTVGEDAPRADSSHSG